MARAEGLFVFGPRGSANERRVLVVLEDASGGCVREGGRLRFESDDGIEVERLERAGPCAEWIRVRSPTARPSITLRAISSDGTFETQVLLSESELLSVQVQRRGSQLRVRASGLPDSAAAFAFVDGERFELRRHRGSFLGQVEAGRAAGVVVQSGERVGAALVPPADCDAPQILVMPTSRSIEAGTVAREVVFVGAFDERCRPTRTLPISIESSAGQLQSMRWVSPGLALIGLCAAEGRSAIDLRVSVGEEQLSSVELPVSAHWPVDGGISPTLGADGRSVTLAGHALAADGSPLPAERLRIRCAGSLHEIGASCEAEERTTQLTLLANVDGAWVPLSVAEIEATGVSAQETGAAPGHAAMAESSAEASSAEQAQAAISENTPTTERLEVFIGLRHDLDARFGVTGGARYLAPLPYPWALGALFRYETHFIAAAPANDVIMADLHGTRHLVTAGAVFGVHLELLPDIEGILRAEVDIGLVSSIARFGNLDWRARGVRTSARVYAGGRFALGDIRLGADIYLGSGYESDSESWGASILNGGVEVNGSFGG